MVRLETDHQEGRTWTFREHELLLKMSLIFSRQFTTLRDCFCSSHAILSWNSMSLFQASSSRNPYAWLAPAAYVEYVTQQMICIIWLPDHLSLLLIHADGISAVSWSFLSIMATPNEVRNLMVDWPKNPWQHTPVGNTGIPSSVLTCVFQLSISGQLLKCPFHVTLTWYSAPLWWPSWLSLTTCPCQDVGRLWPFWCLLAYFIPFSCTWGEPVPFFDWFLQPHLLSGSWFPVAELWWWQQHCLCISSASTQMCLHFSRNTLDSARTCSIVPFLLLWLQVPALAIFHLSRLAGFGSKSYRNHMNMLIFRGFMDLSWDYVMFCYNMSSQVVCAPCWGWLTALAILLSCLISVISSVTIIHLHTPFALTTTCFPSYQSHTSPVAHHLSPLPTSTGFQQLPSPSQNPTSYQRTFLVGLL